MVRGDSRCPRFCSTCRDDCRCQASNCDICHTCRDKGKFGTPHYGGTLAGCKTFSHNCQWHLKAADEKLEKEKEEKAKKDLGSKVVDFPKLFDSEIVKVSVGQSTASQDRFIPRNVLKNNAEYFRRVFSFEERAGSDTQESIILDTEVDRPDAFDCFIQYAYWKDYFTRDDSSDNKLETVTLHAYVYVLAERLQALPLKDLAIRKASEIAVTLNSVTSTSWVSENYREILPCMISDVYLNTPSPPEKVQDGSKHENEPDTRLDRFRQLLCAFSARHLSCLKDGERFQECLRVFPDFAVDLMLQLPDRGNLVLDGEGYLKG